MRVLSQTKACATVLGVAAALVAGLTGCGLPGDGDVRTMDSDDVPYHLLEDEPTPGDGAAELRVPTLVPVVFWLGGNDRLFPAAAASSCEEDAARVVEQVLDELVAGPGEVARSSGRSSALPPESGLGLIAIADGVAQVDFSPATTISPERLPLAVGQVVLAVTSSPGVNAVSLISGGEPASAPLPGGALTSDPLTADDYAPLLPDRHRDSDSAVEQVSETIGCPPA